MKYSFLYYLLIFILIIGIATAGLFIYDNSVITNPNDFTYMPHYVKFHIYPEHEGISVAAWATDDFPPTSGYTDNNSEIVFPMISTAEYNILIDQNKCSYYIYPHESEYYIYCGDKIK